MEYGKAQCLEVLQLFEHYLVYKAHFMGLPSWID
jgi:hypothetical protein